MTAPDSRLRVLADNASAQRRADTLLVMLAGAYDGPELFIDNGFAAACRERSLALDLRFLATELDAVAQGSMPALVHDRVLAPARAEGYRRIVLGGISIGGQVALIHADEYRDSVDGLVLIAPYPGNRMITRTIEDAGGLAAWQPGALTPDQGELRAWRSLRRSASGEGPPLWLGWGREDRFAAAHRMMAAPLDPETAVALPGGHDWPTWKNLWNHLLDNGRLR